MKMAVFKELITKWFTYYDASKDNNQGISYVMIGVAISVVLLLIKQIFGFEIGLSDEQILQISEWTLGIVAIIAAGVRIDATKPLSMRVDSLPSVSRDNVGRDEHVTNILDDD